MSQKSLTASVADAELHLDSFEDDGDRAAQFLTLAKKYTDSSFSHIGKIVGKRDHATVLHACKTVKDQIETNKSFRSSVEEIEALLKA